MTPDRALADRLAAIHGQAFSSPWSAQALTDLCTRPGAVLEAADDGFALLQVAGDEAEVLTLAVRPSAQGRGLGADLMRRSLVRAAALGARRVFLEVAEDNAAARALYARLGFEAAGRRPRYYARPGGPAADALLLVLNLPDPLG